MLPDGSFVLPPDGFDGTLPPPPPGFGPDTGFIPPPPDGGGTGPLTIPPPQEGFQGDGGFFAPPEGFDSSGIFFVPPEGFQGDAVFVPPPPPDFDGDGFFFPPSETSTDGRGFEAPPDFFEVYNGFPPPPPDFQGDWQPPPPQEWDGASGWMPPPPDELYSDGEWFPPPPPVGWEGQWFPPPPPPPGLEEFPGGIFFSNKLDDFVTEQGFDQAPAPFEQFPFDEFLVDHSLNDIIPNIPPPFVHGELGQFEFGQVPPKPPGFPSFRPPPEFIGPSGEFGAFFGPPPNGPPPGAPDGPPVGPPPDLPPRFFEFSDRLSDIDAFLSVNDFAPPPGSDTGPPLPPGEGPPPGGPAAPELTAVDYDRIAALLPETFLPPEEVAVTLEEFGSDHPLIGDGGVVNPELEAAASEHPPVPEEFDAFDFSGDTEQFDDLFTVYDETKVGTTQRGQVNATFTLVLDDGTELRCSDTTVVESVVGEATPLIQMEPGVFQTQWVVNIRRLTNSNVEIVDPNNPATTENVEQTKESFSQMTWTMLMKEVDTTGDGVPNEMQVSGTNNVSMLGETVEGDLASMLGGLTPPAPPPLLLPFQFEGVLDLGGSP